MFTQQISETILRAIELQDEAIAELEQASGYRRGFTDRSDPHLHTYQRLTWQAVLLAEEVGMTEPGFYRFYNEYRELQ